MTRGFKLLAVFGACAMLGASWFVSTASADTGPNGSGAATTHAERGGAYSHRGPHLTPLVQPGARRAAAPAGAHLTYFGGRVVSNIQVVQVLWGSGSFAPEITSTATPSLATMYQQVSNSPYFDWLTEYNTPVVGGTGQTIGHGSFAGQYTITPSTSATTIADSVIQSEISTQIADGHLPAPIADAAGNDNTYYSIFFPHGDTITQGGSSSCVAGGFAAYHGTIPNAAGHGEVYYGVQPDFQPGSGCDTGTGAGSQFQNEMSVATHEMVETVTDPEVGVATILGPPLAWYDSVNGEIGDICNAQPGPIVGADGQTYTVQYQFSNTYNDCIVTPPPPANDFSIAASPSSLSVVAGGASGTTSVSTAVTAGSTQSVALSASGLPSGVTASFSPASVTAGQSSTLTISANAAAAAGTTTINITGTGSPATHTTTLTLTVTAATVPPDFSIAASPSSLSMPASTSATTTVSTALTSGSAQSVALSASGLPSGVTASFSPASVTAGQSSTLTISASAATAAGTTTITITGTGTSATHTTTITLTVTAATPPPPDFSIAASPSSLSMPAGTSATTSVSTAVTSGPAQSVTLSTSGLPSGVTASFSPASVTAGQSSTLTLSASAATPAGTTTLTITGTGTSATHTTTITLTVTASVALGITNGGFESGLSGWTRAGTTAAVTSVPGGCHGGTSCAQLGSNRPTNGDSSVAQTFTAAAGTTQLSLWFREACPDTITFDWALATLTDNTTGTTANVLAKQCTTTVWTQVATAVTAGHAYTLTLVSHDDNHAGDATYTLYDDVTLTAPPPPPPTGITNGGFESGLSGWTTAGTTAAVASGCHGGTTCARLGSTSPTNGDSSVSQTFTASAATTQLSLWFKETCPDTIKYDWALATLKDNTDGTTLTVLTKRCATTAWTHVTRAIKPGHSYTLTLVSHDDNFVGDATYTLYDDVTTN